MNECGDEDDADAIVLVLDKNGRRLGHAPMKHSVRLNKWKRDYDIVRCEDVVVYKDVANASKGKRRLYAVFDKSKAAESYRID